MVDERCIDDIQKPDEYDRKELNYVLTYGNVIKKYLNSSTYYVCGVGSQVKPG